MQSGTRVAPSLPARENTNGWPPSTTSIRTPATATGSDGDGVGLLGHSRAPRFRTQVKRGGTAPFSFAVLGDWGEVDADGRNPDQAAVLHQIAQSPARFAVTTGDTAYPSGSQRNYGDLVQRGPDTSAVFGPAFWARPGSSTALFNAQGNHGLNPTALVNWPEFARWRPRAADTACIGTAA